MFVIFLALRRVGATPRQTWHIRKGELHPESARCENSHPQLDANIECKCEQQRCLTLTMPGPRLDIDDSDANRVWFVGFIGPRA